MEACLTTACPEEDEAAEAGPAAREAGPAARLVLVPAGHSRDASPAAGYPATGYPASGYP